MGQPQKIGPRSANLKNIYFRFATLSFVAFLLVIFLSNNLASAWTDNVLSNTPIRKTHIDELRATINAKRTAAGMAVFAFTDPALVAGTSLVRAKHFLELEQAIQLFYENDALWSAWFHTTYDADAVVNKINFYTSSIGGYVNPANTGPSNKIVSGADVLKLRELVDNAGRCGDTVCQIYNGRLATDPLASPEGCGPGKCDVDCDTPCSTVNSACSGGSLACGSLTCLAGQRCATTTCYCTTTYACINDGACPTTCPAQSYDTGACGIKTLPLTAVGNVGSVNCTGSCSGSVTGTCSNNGTFTGITNGCTLSNCPAEVVQAGNCGDVTLPATAATLVGTAYCPTGTCGTVSATCNGGTFGPRTQDCRPAYWSTFNIAANTGPVSPGSLTVTANNQSFTTCYPASIAAYTVLSISGTGCGSAGNPGAGCTLTVTNSCPATSSCSDGIQNYGEAGVDCGGPCNACPGCPVTPVATGTGCGVGSLPARPHSLNLVSAACPSGCSGSITGYCNMGAYNSISNNCRGACGATNCYACSGAPGPGASCNLNIMGTDTASDCGGFPLCY